MLRFKQGFLRSAPGVPSPCFLTGQLAHLTKVDDQAAHLLIGKHVPVRSHTLLRDTFLDNPGYVFIGAAMDPDIVNQVGTKATLQVGAVAHHTIL